VIVVVMGVTGTGKSSVGEHLAASLGLPYIEGDDFHDPASIEKMRKGIGLTAADRGPWIDRLHHELVRHGSSGAVLACSALTEEIRRQLSADLPTVRYVFLRGDERVLRSRLEARKGHYAGADLLTSQLETLEAPEHAIEVDVSGTPDSAAATALAGLQGERPPAG